MNIIKLVVPNVLMKQELLDRRMMSYFEIEKILFKIKNNRSGFLAAFDSASIFSFSWSYKANTYKQSGNSVTGFCCQMATVRAIVEHGKSYDLEPKS